jgi:YidC/Oxa1 family membrane protein insertase
MTDMRRTLLWVVFVMSLVLLWDAWSKHTGAPSLFGGSPRPQVAASTPPVPGSSAAGAGAGTVPIANTAPTTAMATPATPGGTAATPANAGELITVTTDLVKATVDSRGGELVHLELLHQHDQFDRSRNVVLFDRSRERVYLARTGLATVDGVAYPNHETLFQVIAGPREMAAGSDTLELKLESPVVGGVQLRKTYTFKRSDYRIGVKQEVVNSTDKPVSPQLYLQLVRDGNAPAGESSFYFTFTGPAMYTDAKKFQKVEFKDIDKNKTDYSRSANDGWIAMVQHYFASAWLIGDSPREYVASKLGDNLYGLAMIVKLDTLAPRASVTYDATLFAGPQEEKKLEAMAPGLELVKDYGKFTILAKPLYWLLDQLHKVLGNWGWSIVALVVLLKIAFYWLNASAYRSMAKMKAINPKVMEMRERLKDKPQQMQQEMMRIYREEKVNPLGGCLPIVVQIPFFIALYWVLLSSVEMRNAPWIGWIHDLSFKDPYYILPLLMTGSTLFQTWLNPTPPDPVQAKMMWIMPLVFSVMFFVFPAGLVLYWLTNNLLSIAQQWFINKRLGVAPSLSRK